MNCSEVVARAGWKILVVDADPAAETLARKNPKAGAAPQRNSVRVAASVDAAECEMRRQPADVLFVNLQVGDNAGLELIRKCKRRWPRTHVIAVSRIRRSEHYLEAWRAGASDMLHAPLSPADIDGALANLAVSQAGVERLSQRNDRLRVVCRRLNKARHEISQQVDLLCNDLVRAYQEMAQQLNFTQVATDYAQSIRNEIEVEGILRTTMEWILKKLGPVNAAIYLPNGEDHFALGAYLNLDTKAESSLVEAMGRTVVDQARGGTLLALEDDRATRELFGDDAEPLLGRSWLAMGCLTSRECLAVLVVFKHNGKQGGSDAATRGIIEAIAPVLAERLERALGFHQRLHPFEEDDGGQEMDMQ